MLRVLLVTSEAYPLAKSGGLADAVSGLAHAIQQAGAEVTILIPGYRQAMGKLAGATEVASLPDLPGGPATLLTGKTAQLNVPLLLLRNDALYDRPGGLYCDAAGREFADNDLRFAALSHAAVAIAAGRTALPVPHVVHANDWHAALTPLLLKAAGLSRIKTVLTIHNLAFQGLFPLDHAEALGIPAAWRGAEGVECWDRLSFMKAGLTHADRITTVSHTYAREILTPEHGMGLDTLLRSRQQALLAIPNGIDTDVWNPTLDTLLAHHYCAYDLTGKRACKRELQQCFGLTPDDNATVLVSGSRLTTQKMADVAVEALPLLLDRHAQLQVAVLGCGDTSIESALTTLAQRYPGRLDVHLGYDERRAHLLHAGGDILLHGSRFEPFGLTPLYAMLYGTIPVCSAVGGMMDTVTDAQPEDLGQATGILFDNDTPQAMVAAVERALALHRQPQVWRRLQCNGMLRAFGWDEPAAMYLELYRSLAPIHVKVPQTPPLRRRQLARPPLNMPDVHAYGVTSLRQRSRQWLEPPRIISL